MNMSDMGASLIIVGNIMGIKRNEQWGNRLQFILQSGEEISQIDVKIADGDKTVYQANDRIKIQVRAFVSKSGVGFEAIGAGQKVEK